MAIKKQISLKQSRKIRRDDHDFPVYPKIEELSFRQALLADPATMAYNARWGGCIDFPQKKWADWYDRWIVNTQGKRFYAYLYNGEEKCFVGEVACHLDEESGRYLLNVLVHDRFRGREYGTKGLELLCAQCRKMGCTEVYDDIAVDNPSLSLFLKQGFCEVGRTEDAVIVKKYL